MPWSVFIVRRAERDLERLDERTRALIVQRIREAALDPGSADLAKLGDVSTNGGFESGVGG
jgi:mRNA-degrading endonuclease RelE of RelBE toxin-antitoxin system